MDFEAIRAGLADAVPYNRHLGLEITEVAPGHGVVRLPDVAEIRNHVGSQHAGALFSAGEAASGAAFVGAFAERLGELRPLAESAEIAYTKLAQGVITATGELAASADELLSQLDAEGRVRFEVGVTLTNAVDETVAEMSVRWYVRKAQPSQ